jgi:hypothetical protein
MRLRSVEGRPEAVFLVAARPPLASVVEQSLTYVLPGGVWTVEPDSVDFLNFDDRGCTWCR